MLLSKEDMFSEDQTITATENAVTYSTNVLDWGAHGNDIDKELRLFVLTKNTAASAGAATLTIAIETSADNVTFTALKTYTALALAALATGQFVVNNDVLPNGLLKYVRISYTVLAAAFTTAPKLDAGIIRNDGYVTR